MSGSDYDAVGGTLNFAPGQTVQTVRVPLINDTTVEAKEDFLFNVFNASNAVVGNSSAMATIIDNNSPSGKPVISIGNRVVDESSGEVRFAVTLNRPSTGVVTGEVHDVAGNRDHRRLHHGRRHARIRAGRNGEDHQCADHQ